MDIGFWIGAAVGFITFVISFCLAIKERREKDPDWKWAAVLAIVGLIGTGVSVHQGITAERANAAAKKRLDDADKELAKAQGSIEGEKRARAQLVEALKTRRVPEYMNLKEFAGTNVVLVCAKEPESLWFTHSLGFELEMQGWRIVDAQIRDRMPMTGVSATTLHTFQADGSLKEDAALKARKALLAELEKGGVDVRPGGELGGVPPNIVKIFVGPTAPLISPSEIFPNSNLRAKSVEEFVGPVFRKWQSGNNAFVIPPEQVDGATSSTSDKK